MYKPSSLSSPSILALCLLLTLLLSHNVFSTTFDPPHHHTIGSVNDSKCHCTPPPPHRNCEPSPPHVHGSSHGGRYSSPPPLGGGGGGGGGTGGGGVGGGSTTPVTIAPPTNPTITPPTTPIIVTPTAPPTPSSSPTPPFLPDPNTPVTGTCYFWRTHPNLIWNLVGWWATVGETFGTTSTLPGPVGGSGSGGEGLNLLEALSSTRTDGIGALYREGTASLLNSLANKKFHFTSAQVKDGFVAAIGSNKAAAAQARVFKKANEGHLKPRP